MLCMGGLRPDEQHSHIQIGVARARACMNKYGDGRERKSTLCNFER